MNYIILSDIHGDTNYLRQFGERLQGRVEYLTPYSRIDLNTKRPSESQYEFFKRVSSLDVYFESALNKLKQSHSPVSVIGFSVGATVAWRLAALDLPTLNQCIGVFGSRIRDYLYIKPVKPTVLLFSNEEHYFSTDVFESNLVKKLQLAMPHDDIKTIADDGILSKTIFSVVKR